MSFIKPFPKPVPPPHVSDFTADHRTRLALAESEKQERKRADQAEQTSGANTPEQRIRVWERVHGIALPRDAEHPLLKIIAERTGLSLAEVSAEQARRGPVTTRRSGRVNLSWNAGPIR